MYYSFKILVMRGSYVYKIYTFVCITFIAIVNIRFTPKHSNVIPLGNQTGIKFLAVRLHPTLNSRKTTSTNNNDFHYSDNLRISFS